ncbi:MAG: MBL fold metallo-hydrolase [Firmicutes bacterium]|nr:MBL fold metallo-hydrolase [Dethiobacter sp.]MBS3889004.1 MBL fold metallo-hydrolase [Bacillota bacterium]MBS4054035.1 MBL fold metallo-hydrolase [Thermaerobacter sp.]
MRRILFAAVIVLAILSLLGCQSHSTIPALFTAHFIDVGQGDSILLQAGAQNILIDAGDRASGARVVAYLRAQGVRKIDLLIATHPHADHIGGLEEVFQQMPVARIIDSGQVHTTQTFLNYLRTIDDKNIPFETPAGQIIELAANVELRVIGPLRAYDNLNDGSVVVMVRAGTVSLLLTGDMESDAERDLLQAGGLSATVLKVGHHGSNTSSTTDFLQAVRPRVAIISVGADNSFGHPSPAVLARLREVGADIYRTDRHGTIVLRTDGETFSIRTERK